MSRFVAAGVPLPLPIALGGTGSTDIAGLQAALGVTASLPANAGLVERSGIPLIEGGWAPLLFGAAPGFAPGAAVARASAGTGTVDGAQAEFAAGAPRWVDWPGGTNRARALLLGGQRTNSLRNPRAEGAVAGTPGTAPTFWTLSSGQGINSSVVGSGVEAGRPYVDVRWSGTATGTGSVRPTFDAAATVAALTGQTWTGSLFIALVGGSLAGTTGNIGLRMEELSSGGTVLVAAPLTAMVPTGAAQRFTVSRAFADPGTAFTRLALQFSAASTGSVIDFTLRLSAPQLEQGGFASAPILPPPGTLAASTRLADVLPALPLDGPATLRLEGVVPTLPGAADGNMMLAQFDAGADTDRLRLHLPAGGTQLVAGRVVGGTATDAAALGTVTPGARWVALLRHDGAGTLGACMSGASSVTTLAGGLAGVTSLLLGNNRAGTSPLFGLIRSARAWPRALSDAEMLAQLT